MNLIKEMINRRIRSSRVLLDLEAINPNPATFQEWAKTLRDLAAKYEAEPKTCEEYIHQFRECLATLAGRSRKASGGDQESEGLGK